MNYNYIPHSVLIGFIVSITIIGCLFLILCLWFIKIKNRFNKQTRQIMESEENIRITLNSIADAIIATDTNGLITRMNPIAEKITGWSFHNAEGEPLARIFNIIDNQTGKTSKNPVEKILETSNIIELANDTMLIAKDGSKYQIADSGAPIKNAEGKITGVVLVFRDISDEYKIKENLKKNEKHFRTLMEQSPIAMQIYDINGTLVYANQALADLWGIFDLNKLTGYFNLFKNAQMSGINLYHYYKKAFSGEQVDIPEIEIFPNPDINRIKKRIVKIKAYPLKNPDGSFENIVIFNEDITKQKYAEEELQKMQKLKSIGTLAGGIAHDFNNILTGLYGNISLIKEEISKDHHGFKFIEEAESSMNRAIRLTKQLLTFSKGGEPVKEDLNIGKIVKETVSLDLSDNKVIFVFDQVKDLWPAEVDKGQIQHVFSQLAINAKQAMPDGGHLYITLLNNKIPANNIFNINRGKYVKAIVKDEGIGIDPKHLDRIFDPYFTTKKTDSGLGLATAYSIINKHKGHITVESEPGKGTTFTIFLPASAQDKLASTEVLEQQAGTYRQTGKILVMDDEMIIRTLTTRILERTGYSAATAECGAQAIEIYRKSIDDNIPFDAIIMDLTIPGGIGGKEAVKEILSINPNAVCIVSSGYADDPVMANYADYGFKDAVAKPYTIAELEETLQRVFKKH